jgi:hypothetical protein
MPLDNDLGKAPAIARERSKSQFGETEPPHLHNAQFKIQPRVDCGYLFLIASAPPSCLSWELAFHLRAHWQWAMKGERIRPVVLRRSGESI